MKKAGFISIVGLPNAGKSTLMNKILGEKLSIISYKPQTTRKSILGIHNHGETQMIFFDTPGILDPMNLLHEKMLQFIKESIDETDIILWILDINSPLEIPDLIKKNLAQQKQKILMVINKIDKCKDEEIKNSFEQNEELKDIMKIFISAKNGDNIDSLLKKIDELLPVHYHFYPEDYLTDKSERFYASEIIREQILLYFEKEIPYCVEIVIEKFKDLENILHIDAVIYVERESQKAILIGMRGKALKEVGTRSRLALEQFFKKHVCLKERIKVLKNWRMDANALRRFNYDAN
jgi:GTP-binding protein Era